MPIRRYKPTSPGRRFMTVSTFEEVTKTKPEKSLTEQADEEGRPEQQRPHHDAPPGRRPQAPLPRHRLQAHEGRRAREGRRDRVRPEPLGADRAAALRGRREELHPRSRAAARRRRRSSPARAPTSSPATRCRSTNIPTGTLVHNVELKPGRGGQMARSAGSGVQLVAKDDGYGVLRLPSGEMRRVPLAVPRDHRPGRQRRPRERHGRQGRDAAAGRGKRPTVRGSAMNPVDHPHGGGEGKSKGGRHPVTPVGRADARQAHAPQAQGIRPADRPRPPPRQGEALSEPELQEGAVRRGAADEPHRGDERVRARSG